MLQAPPSLEIQENVALAPLTTFRVGGTSRYFVQAEDEESIDAAVRWAEQRHLPFFVLGGGSNLLVTDDQFPGVVLRVNLRGIERQGGTFDVAAGEPWDDFVQWAVEANCAGIECLAGIPGSTGGTPVQNVGAYGQEIAQTVTRVRAFDRQAKQYLWLTRAECGFRYRESIFNTAARGRYIVTRVRFSLQAGGAPNLSYADLQKRFPGEARPTLVEVAEAVRAIRKQKGMVVVPGDPDTQSAGSYFKNPVVPTTELSRVAKGAGVAAEDVPNWPAGEGRTKLPAAWLLERAGFIKGYGTGPARISSRHTLALTNRGGAHFADVMALERMIVAGVQERFGIKLEREPVVLRA